MAIWRCFSPFPSDSLIGAVVGTVGGGGAILALPILVYVLDQGVSSASTASLIVVALGASVGAGSQARDGQLCWRVALTFSVPAALGAYLGTLAGGRGQPESAHPRVRSGDARGCGPHLPPRRQRGRSPPRRRATVRSRASLAPAVPGSSSGVMTGFFGVGGGFLIVPALTILLGLGDARAIATSLAIITLTGVAALISHLATGAQPNWPLTARPVRRRGGRGARLAVRSAGASLRRTLAQRVRRRRRDRRALPADRRPCSGRPAGWLSRSPPLRRGPPSTG